MGFWSLLCPITVGPLPGLGAYTYLLCFFKDLLQAVWSPWGSLEKGVDQSVFQRAELINHTGWVPSPGKWAPGLSLQSIQAVKGRPPVSAGRSAEAGPREGQYLSRVTESHD